MTSQSKRLKLLRRYNTEAILIATDGVKNDGNTEEITGSFSIGCSGQDTSSEEIFDTTTVDSNKMFCYQEGFHESFCGDDNDKIYSSSDDEEFGNILENTDRLGNNTITHI